MITLRMARPADAPAIARLHVQVWRSTYQGLATPAAYAALDEPRRLAQWQEKLQQPGKAQVLLAESADQLVGFCLADAPSHPQFGEHAEIKSLFVSDKHQRQGIGRRLLGAAASEMLMAGYRSIALGVVEGNDSAMRFYLALGGTPAGNYTDPGPLWRSSNVIYVWPDIHQLAAVK
ncbi:Protease synthase and sporulation negative regulatory protein PAI 1 [compost metagenome]